MPPCLLTGGKVGKKAGSLAGAQHIQQISIPLVAKNNVRNHPGHTRIVSAALKTGKTTFTPRNTIIGKGVAYARLFDTTLSL